MNPGKSPMNERRKKHSSRARDEERHLESVPKMSKLAKDTLKEIAKDPRLPHYEIHVCPPHEHDVEKCFSCLHMHRHGVETGKAIPSERIVYRTPWFLTIVTMGMTMAAMVGWNLFLTHPRIIHDTVKIYDPVQDALVKQLDFENGELRDQHSQDVGQMAAVHQLLDMGKFHAAYKMSKPKESK